MNDKKNVNYTNNDGAKYRYSAPRNTEAKKPEKIKEALTKRAVLWRTNKVLAIVILVAVVLLSSTLSIYRAVSGRSSLVEEYYGEIKDFVVKMTDGAKGLVSLADVVIPESADLKDTKSLLSKIDTFAEDPFWEDVTAAKSLHDKAQSLFNQIYHGNAGGSAKDSAKEYFDTTDRYYKLLGSSAHYTAAAKEYNRVASTFPVGLLSLDRVPVFEHYDDIEVTPQETSEDHEEQSTETGAFTEVVESVVSGIKSKLSSFSPLKIAATIVIAALVLSYVFGRGKRR